MIRRLWLLLTGIGAFMAGGVLVTLAHAAGVPSPLDAACVATPVAAILAADSVRRWWVATADRR